MAEEKALQGNAETCQEARANLTSPRKRLDAELAWLPGVSPTRANQLLLRLWSDPTSVGDESGLPPLARANLIAASLEAAGDQEWGLEIAPFIIEVARLVDDVTISDVMRYINEDRAIAGFPAISNPDEIETGLAERQRYFRNTIKVTVDTLPTPSLIQVMTQVLDEATAGGHTHPPELINLLLDTYEIETQDFIEKEAENVRRLISAVLSVAPRGEEELGPIIDQLEAVARNWDKVAQPIQLGFKARGTQHEPSMELARATRSLGIELFNKHDMAASALRITALLKELFAELPEFLERVDEDEKALTDAAKTRDEWEREILTVYK